MKLAFDNFDLLKMIFAYFTWFKRDRLILKIKNPTLIEVIIKLGISPRYIYSQVITESDIRCFVILPNSAIAEKFNTNQCPRGDYSSSWIGILHRGNSNYSQVLKGHKEEVCFIIFHHEIKALISGSLDGNIRLWDYNNNFSCLGEIESGIKKMNLLVLPGGKVAASGNSKYSVWDCSNYMQILTGYIYSGRQIHLALDNGDLVIKNDKDLYIYQNNDFNNYTVRSGHTGKINSVIQLPKANLASCSEDKTIRIWDSANKYWCIYTLTADVPINDLLYLPDGIIMAGSYDRNIRIWYCENNWDKAMLSFAKYFAGFGKQRDKFIKIFKVCDEHANGKLTQGISRVGFLNLRDRFAIYYGGEQFVTNIRVFQ
jgi:WD40 repeat protein